jgi:glycosyltransferase involved in cell wall biosynthesis
MPAKFSILVANYNNGRYFKDCYNSILAQEYENFEVVIVDDASTDHSVKEIEAIIKNDPRVVFVKNDVNKGCGYTKARCAELAKGEICAFVDPDDALEPKALQTMADAFNSHKDAALIYSKYRRYNDSLQQLISEHQLRAVDSRDPLFFNLAGVISHFAAFSKKAYLKTAGIDPYMLRAVDQDLYLKLCEAGEVIAIDTFLYKYRVHQSGISTGTDMGNATKAEYWHWYAVNAAAKRRGVYVENMFPDVFVKKSSYNRLLSDYQLLTSGPGYKLLKKMASVRNFIFRKNSGK